MVADVSPQGSPAYLVVNRHGVIAIDIAATIRELDPDANVVVAMSLPEAAALLAALDRIVLAVIEGTSAPLCATPLGQALAARGAPVLLLDSDETQVWSYPKLVILGLPFSTAALLTALRLALG